MTPLKTFVCALAWACAALAQQGRSAQGVTDRVFVWNRPKFVLDRLPITRSATCRFKASVNVTYTGDQSDRKTKIQYFKDAVEEADTVSFVDLDGIPKVQSNGGQAELIVLFNNEQTIGLLNKKGLQSPLPEVELYTIFKDSGVIIHSTQHKALLSTPSGVTEMGYCN